MLHETSSHSRCGTLGAMKQPRLPGAEKFKFSSPVTSNDPTTDGHSQQSQVDALATTENGVSLSLQMPKQGRFVPRYSQSELNPLMCTLSVSSLNRSDPRRKAVLPITCRKTSRMLTNTNLELNIDQAELILEDDVKAGRLNLDNSRMPSCPNLESSRSLNSSKISLDAYSRKMSLQNKPIRENPIDWMNIRALPSRLSASCSSSCSSEENVWVLREDKQ